MQIRLYSYFLLVILFSFSSKLFAQKDTIYFDKDWKIVGKENALYYRIKPQKIKTKKAIGYKIENVDSLFVIKDYYLSDNQIQFQGYSKDHYGNNLAGKAEWFDENGKKTNTTDFIYPKEIENPKFKLPELPVFYVDYRNANKNLFTGGIEFCGCEASQKLFLGVGFGVTSHNGNTYGLPDLHISYNNADKFLFLKIGTSDKHAYGIAGLTLLNFIDLGVGYSQPFNNNKVPEMKGFTFGTTLRFAGNSKNAYKKLNIGF